MTNTVTFRFSATEQALIIAARAQCPVGDDPNTVNSNGNWVPLYTTLSNIIGRHFRVETAQSR
jgi:hypothetical protein